MNMDEFVQDMPKLHHWGEEWSTGGFTEALLKFLYTTVSQQCGDRPPAIVETGAGNSTIVFLLAKARRVASFALEADLGDRIFDYCASKDIPTTALEFIAGRSETTLPPFAATNAKAFDIALIDGGHGWPTTFIDFCYLNAMLKQDGVLLVDDIQLYSVRELAKFIDNQPHFNYVGNLGKLYAWRKVWDHEFLPDFGAQPYIRNMTARVAETEDVWSLPPRPSE